MRYSFLIGLVFILALYSCQTKTKESQVNKSDTLKSPDTNSSVQDSRQQIPDTLTVGDRFQDGDTHRSHIALDFAQTTDTIEDTNLIQTITEICVISVVPDTSWINKQQQEMGEENWNTVVDDNQYYTQKAIETLVKLQIPERILQQDKRYIRFIKSDKSEFTIDLLKMKDAWGLILFNGNDNPVLWSSTDIDNEIKEIYKK